MSSSFLASLPRGLAERQARFLLHLSCLPALSRRDYEALSGVCDTTAQRDLADLLQAGLILRHGRGRASRYSISPHLLDTPFESPAAPPRCAQFPPVNRPVCAR